MPIIDFENSRMEWCTRAEQSAGFWQIESALRVENSEIDQPIIYALSPAVTAGNLYSKPMIIEPPYEFRFVASQFEYMISRHSYVANTTRIETGDIASLFKSFSIHWSTLDRSALSEDEIIQSASSGERLVAAVSGSEDGGLNWQSSFPVKHINVNNGSTGYQIETSPVLIYTNHQGVSDTRLIDNIEVANISFNNDSEFEVLILRSHEIIRSTGSINVYSLKNAD